MVYVVYMRLALQEGGTGGVPCTSSGSRGYSESPGSPLNPTACGSAAREQIQGGAGRAPGVSRSLHPAYRLRAPHSS